MNVRLPILLQPQVSGAPKAERIIHPARGSLILSKEPLSTATLELKAEEMIPVRSLVQMFSPFGSEGVFRVRTATSGYGGDSASNVELEHAITEIGDYLVTTDTEQTTTLAAGLAAVFAYYRGSLWQLGTITANDSVLLNTSHENVLEAMNSLMEQAPGYMYTFDFSTFPWTLGIAQTDGTVTAEGRLGRNITDVSVSYDDTDLCTRAIVEYQTDGGKTTNYLTVNADTIGTYGVVEKFISGSYSQAEAQIVGDAYIAAHKRPTVAVEIEGTDLSKSTGEALDTFRPGKKFRLALPKYGVTVEQGITSMEWDDLFGNPEHVNVSLADVEDPVIRFLKKQNRSGSGAGKAAKKQNKNYWTKFEQTDTQITLQAGYISDNQSILRQAGLELNAQGVLVYAEEQDKEHGLYLGSKFYVQSQAISAEVTRATTEEGLISGRLEVTADAVTAEVTRATGEEGRLSGLISVESGKIQQIVTAVGKNGEVTAASIATAINSQTGQGVVEISADIIDIQGLLTALEAESITCGDIDCQGSLEADQDITAGGTVFGMIGSFSDGLIVGEEDINVADVTVSGNTLTITYVDGSTETFSKAVTSLDKSWSNGVLSVTPQPQGSPTLNQYILDSGTKQNLDGSAYTTGNTWYVPVNVKDNPGDAGAGSPTGLRVYVSAVGRWNDGYDTAYGYVSDPNAAAAGTEVLSFSMGVPKSDRSGSTSKTFTLSKGATPASSGFAAVSLAGVGVVGRIQIGDWYTAGVTAGEAEFTQATVTLQGTSVDAYEEDTSSSGTTYYKSGTTKYDRGDQVTCREKLNSGGSLYYTTSNGIKVAHHGKTTLYKREGTSSGYTYTVVAGGEQDWYYISSNGVQYYTRSNSVRLNDSDSNFYKGNGGPFSAIDSANKVQVKAKSTLYKAGTVDSTSYYTKS